MAGSDFCPQCGTARLGAFRYCPSCGFDFDTATAGQGAPAPTQPLRQPQSFSEQYGRAVNPVPVAPAPAELTGGANWALIGGLVMLVGLGAIAGLFLAGGSRQPSGLGLGTAVPAPTQRATQAPTAAPWPDDYESFVCEALQQLRDSAGHLLATAEAAGVYDVDAVLSEAKAAAKDAKEAAGFLGTVPLWRPGQAVVDALQAQATETQKAANLWQIAITAVDEQALADGTASLEQAIAHWEDASAAFDGLRASTGFSCT